MRRFRRAFARSRRTDRICSVDTRQCRGSKRTPRKYARKPWGWLPRNASAVFPGRFPMTDLSDALLNTVISGDLHRGIEARQGNLRALEELMVLHRERSEALGVLYALRFLDALERVLREQGISRIVFLSSTTERVSWNQWFGAMMLDLQDVGAQGPSLTTQVMDALVPDLMPFSLVWSSLVQESATEALGPLVVAFPNGITEKDMDAARGLVLGPRLRALVEERCLDEASPEPRSAAGRLRL